MKKELNELVAGDLVAYRPALSSRTRIATVKRTTQTQIIISNGEKFRKKDGISVGASGYQFSSITVPSDEELIAIREDEKAAIICSQSINELELAVVAIRENFTKEKRNADFLHCVESIQATISQFNKKVKAGEW